MLLCSQFLVLSPMPYSSFCCNCCLQYLFLGLGLQLDDSSLVSFCWGTWYAAIPALSTFPSHLLIFQRCADICGPPLPLLYSCTFILVRLVEGADINACIPSATLNQKSKDCTLNYHAILPLKWDSASGIPQPSENEMRLHVWTYFVSAKEPFEWESLC